MENSQEQTIAQAAIVARALLAEAELKAALKNTDIQDHSLLIRIDEKLELLMKQFNSSSKDHEMRIRRLELIGAIALGLSYALTFWLNYIKH